MGKTFFTPVAMLPPSLGTGLKVYAEYLQCYQLYVSELSARKCEWKAQVKSDQRLSREAKSLGRQVTKVWETRQTERKFLSASGQEVLVQAIEPAVKKITVAAPASPPVASWAGDAEAKAAAKVKEKARRALKRKRYNANRKVRVLKERAQVTQWQARIKTNVAKAVMADRSIRREKTKPVAPLPPKSYAEVLASAPNPLFVRAPKKVRRRKRAPAAKQPAQRG